MSNEAEGTEPGAHWAGDLGKGLGRGLGPLQKARDCKHLVTEVWVEGCLVLTFFLLPA